MVEGLDHLLSEYEEPGLEALRGLLARLLDVSGSGGRVEAVEQLKRRVYRLGFEVDGGSRSLVVKRLDPEIGRRNALVARRWLPAAGLAEMAPPLLGLVAERSGSSVWHVYEDLGYKTLADNLESQAQVRESVRAIARLHRRFADHALLGECRLWGGDLGIHFFASSLADAIRGLSALEKPPIRLEREQQALVSRLLARLHRLRSELGARTALLQEVGGPESLLHGDLWTTNVFVLPVASGFRVRFIDWDHAAVGPVTYDLSTFLYRFPVLERAWILQTYQEALEGNGWKLPGRSDLNQLFDTAEQGRISNRLIWPALAILRGDEAWAFESLAEIERWYDMLKPVLPEETAAGEKV